MNPISTHIYIVRHGETDWNHEKRIQGHTDIVLNAAGQAQAEALGQMFAARFAQQDKRPTQLFSSDLQRAMQTAACLGVALDLSVQPCASLRERSYGIFEGLSFADAKMRYPSEFARFKAREAAYALPEGGESLNRLHERITLLLSNWAAQFAGQTLVAVTHGGVLDVINRFVRSLTFESERDFLIPNAACNLISHSVTKNGPAWEIEFWGETPPLDAAPLRSMLDETVR